MLSDHDITDVAERVLGAELANDGFDRSYVLPGLGPDGERTLSVVARFRVGAGPVSGKAAIRAISALRKALRAEGEERDALLRYEFPDDDVPAIDQTEFDPGVR